MQRQRVPANVEYAQRGSWLLANRGFAITSPANFSPGFSAGERGTDHDAGLRVTVECQQLSRSAGLPDVRNTQYIQCAVCMRC
jgi:hypothetical protein